MSDLVAVDTKFLHARDLPELCPDIAAERLEACLCSLVVHNICRLEKFVKNCLFLPDLRERTHDLRCKYSPNYFVNRIVSENEKLA